MTGGTHTINYQNAGELDATSRGYGKHYPFAITGLFEHDPVRVGQRSINLHLGVDLCQLDGSLFRGVKLEQVPLRFLVPIIHEKISRALGQEIQDCQQDCDREALKSYGGVREFPSTHLIFTYLVVPAIGSCPMGGNYRTQTPSRLQPCIQKGGQRHADPQRRLG